MERGGEDLHDWQPFPPPDDTARHNRGRDRYPRLAQRQRFNPHRYGDLSHVLGISAAIPFSQAAAVIYRLCHFNFARWRPPEGPLDLSAAVDAGVGPRLLDRVDMAGPTLPHPDHGHRIRLVFSP